MGEETNKNEYKWSDDIEKVLRYIRSNSVLLSKAHKKRYLILKGRLNYYRIPVIVFSAINSVISIGGQSFFSQQAISVTNSIISLICGIIVSIEMFFEMQRQLENELNSSKDFYILATDIHKTMELTRENRPKNSKAFLDDCYNRYISLIQSSQLVVKTINDKLAPLPVDLSDDVLNEYNKKNGKNKFINNFHSFFIKPPSLDLSPPLPHPLPPPSELDSTLSSLINPSNLSFYPFVNTLDDKNKYEKNTESLETLTTENKEDQTVSYLEPVDESVTFEKPLVDIKTSFPNFNFTPTNYIALSAQNIDKKPEYVSIITQKEDD
jgi:hypothetical protein